MRCPRARSTAATACSSITTASRPRWRCGARARASRMDANMLLAWHKYGGGKELLDKLYASIGANVVSFPYGPMPTQPLGWFKKPIAKAEDLKGLKFRTVGISIDVFTGDGRRRQRAAGRRNRLGDGPRPARRGRVQQRLVGPRRSASPTSPRSACCRATTRTPSSSRSCSTRTKYDALPEKMKAIIANAVEAASQDMSWKAIDRYSQGLRRAADQGQRQVLQDAGRDPASSSSRSTTRS